MNHPEFMTAIIEIYGEYSSPLLEKLTFAFVKENFKEEDLENVIKKTMASLPTRFKHPPDPSDFSEIFFKKDERTMEAEALHWWKLLGKNTSYMRDCVISDIRVQSAIESMGGWVWFCTRTVRDESGKDLDVWNQKRFVELFKLYSTNKPEGGIKILRGQSTESEEVRARKIITVGDENICRNLIAEQKNKALKMIDEMSEKLKIE